MNKTLIIYAHPYEKSFNKAVCDQVIKLLDEAKRPYELIDLYEDKFDPAYTKEELRLFSKGETTDPLVEKYQKQILEAEEMIFIFPIWWNDLPAIVKGFIDKVMKYKFAYQSTELGVKGMLTNIKKVNIFTTGASPKWYLKLIAGNAIKKVFIKATLKQVGIKNAHWHHLGQITNISQEKRVKYLKSIKL